MIARVIAFFRKLLLLLRGPLSPTLSEALAERNRLRDCPRVIAESAWWMEHCAQCGRRFDSEREGKLADELWFCGSCFFLNAQSSTELNTP